MQDQVIARVIRAYDNWLVRLYSRIRFHILRQRFLDEIGQYLPKTGQVLDIGCGFGLFSLYYAHLHPDVAFHGVDLDARRIEMARGAAEKLGVTNVSYEVADAATCSYGGRWDAVYMLDLVHHIPSEAVRPLLAQLHALVNDGGCLVIKEVDRKPAYKRWFTYLLDKMMDPKAPVHYWDSKEFVPLLHDVGFRAYCHAMVDYLPYPHVLYICHPQPSAPAACS
ncbi:class I SAM-dependent methyltransferase [bacterium]|nr:class I SAM-dependent methyltransferase [bacterium]